MATQYAKGGSPVADYTDVGNLGMSLYAAQAARNDASHKELMGAVELSNKALTESKKHMMSLPSDVGAVYAEKIEQALEARSKAIMSGGSAVTVSPSIQEFQDLSIGAAKLSAVNIDLVNKFEKMRQSKEYLENKEVYDKWYENSQGIITETAKGDISAVSQLDFFQPPIKEQDLDIIKYGANLFQNAYNAGQYMEKDGKGSSFFQEKTASSDADAFIEKQYNLGSQMASDINSLAALKLEGEQTPAETNESVLRYLSLEDDLTSQEIKTPQQIDALNISASEKRELKNGLAFMEARKEVKSDVSKGLVNSVRQANHIGTKSSDDVGTPYGDFGGNAGNLVNMNINPEAAKNLGLNPVGTYGYSSTKSGTRKQYGNDKEMLYYEGIIFDGKNYYGSAYKPSESFLSTIHDLSTEELKEAVLNPVNFEGIIVPLQKIRGDIPKKDLYTMQQVARDEYRMAKGQAEAEAQEAKYLQMKQREKEISGSVSLKEDGIPGE